MATQKHPSAQRRDNAVHHHKTALSHRKPTQKTVCRKAKPVVSKARRLDQFFTSPDYAKVALGQVYDWLLSQGVDPASLSWLEPSAGAGAFLDVAEERKLSS